MSGGSLRARLVAIILGPLLLIAGALGVWEFAQSRATASALFDRSLLTTALAIARDVAHSGGDALLPQTRDLIADTSGGPVYYHVFAPDGVFVTGYATPPVVPRQNPASGARPPGAAGGRDGGTVATRAEGRSAGGDGVRRGSAEDGGARGGTGVGAAGPLFFDARYQGAEVRVVRLFDATEIDGLSGIFTITVWQDVGVREGLVAELGQRVVAVIAILVVSVAVVVWFGVGAGLAPLRALEAAIAERGPDDLRPIERQVPAEVAGLVARLNALLARVERTMDAQRTFVSNAAHQLRNPLAGLLAMAEAVRGACEPEDRAEREAALVAAARRAADLANQLLLLERASAALPAATRAAFDLSAMAASVVADFSAEAEARGVRLAMTGGTDALTVEGDPTMVREALRNLVANALAHGGAGLGTVEVRVDGGAGRVDGGARRVDGGARRVGGGAGRVDAGAGGVDGGARRGGSATVLVRDDGVGLSPADWPAALERFSQPRPGPGSGLGLSIARTVADALGGELSLRPSPHGTCVALSLPLA